MNESFVEMPNGGYVTSNGISLCDPSKNGGDFTLGCHYKAEMVLKGESDNLDFHFESLYKKIKSSKDKAIKDSERLKQFL